ncbi:hypothetical protein [Variovorax sp. PAMC26660]|uniref:hypothetical protein n=1 Tax=Variovorax sp. PAMC26660 TaxID=2762322 RepID=UPI00164E9D31|nr:hypothetical protein [Variovorax sp. PAMC26660]QNK71833.1 hypothetical protein H7F35_00840 [Variovorax sp. PAMC26660]
MSWIHRRGVLALSAASAASALLAAAGCGQKSAPATATAAPPEPPGAGSLEITQDDIDTFRRSRAEWINCESGAPAIVPADMSLEQFGNLLDGGQSPAFDRFVNVASAFFLHASFAAGHYTFLPPFDKRTSFDVKDEHIRLLQRANWQTFLIDCKRPYGDFTHFEIDMADILGVPVTKDAKGLAQIGKDAEKRMDALHADMLFALQAYIRFARLNPGRYVVPDRRFALHLSRPLCRPVSATRIAMYQRALKAAGPTPDSHRLAALSEAAAGLFALD